MEEVTILLPLLTRLLAPQHAAPIAVASVLMKSTESTLQTRRESSSDEATTLTSLARARLEYGRPAFMARDYLKVKIAIPLS